MRSGRRGRRPVSITRREFLGGAAAAGALGVLGGIGCERAPRRPNLLFVFSDQQSSDMLSCYGNEQIITPNIDELAEGGIRFRHCVSSSPICSPYRGMLMTSQHPLYNGVIENDIQLLTGNGPRFGQVLRDAGYRVGYVGKWHLHGGDRNRPIPMGAHRHGFDGVFLSNNCNLDCRPGKGFYWNERGEKVFFPEWEVFGQTKQALQFLEECTTDQPFALFVSWEPPHDFGKRGGDWYYDTIPELMELYDRAKIEVRPNVEDSPIRRRQYHGYMAMCSGLDIAFGRLMDKLAEKGFEENTVVVYTSDHGDLLGSHGKQLAKGHAEDESARVPLIVRWPGRLPAARTSDLLVGTLDLMPTILGMMGLRVPESCQGQDLFSHILAGRDDAVESVPLMCILLGWRGVYTHRYTYSFVNPWDRQRSFTALYDRESDPHQRFNLYDVHQRRPLREEMHRLTLAWLDRFRDRCLDTATAVKLFMRDGEWPSHLAPGTCVRRGRPIDLLHGANA